MLRKRFSLPLCITRASFARSSSIFLPEIWYKQTAVFRHGILAAWSATAVVNISVRVKTESLPQNCWVHKLMFVIWYIMFDAWCGSNSIWYLNNVLLILIYIYNLYSRMSNRRLHVTQVEMNGALYLVLTKDSVFVTLGRLGSGNEKAFRIGSRYCIDVESWHARPLLRHAFARSIRIPILTQR